MTVSFGGVVMDEKEGEARAVGLGGVERDNKRASNCWKLLGSDVID